MSENTYFMRLLRSSPLSSAIGECCNSETFEIWQQLDIKIRLGESARTAGDEWGLIQIDKTNKVVYLQNDRRYK